MDWKTQIEELKTQLNVRDDGLAERLGITTRTLLDLKKGLKDPTGPVQQLIKALRATQPGGTPSAPAPRPPVHLVLMHGEFELHDGRNKYDAITAIHQHTGGATEYHYLTSPPPTQHVPLILEGLNGRGIQPHFLKSAEDGSSDCQFAAVAMWLAAQRSLTAVTLAAAPARFGALALTIQQYSRADVFFLHSSATTGDLEACHGLASEGVMTANVNGRRFGMLRDAKGERAPIPGEPHLEIESLNDGGQKFMSIPLDPRLLRTLSPGVVEFGIDEFEAGDIVSYDVGINEAGLCATDLALVKSAAKDSLIDSLRARGRRLFSDDNAIHTVRGVRNAIATCAMDDGWANVEFVWSRLSLLAKAGRGWDPGENADKFIGWAQQHRNHFEISRTATDQTNIRARHAGI